MTNDTEVLDKVLGAASLMDLEGATGKMPNRVYLMYARQVHPDMFQDAAQKEKANKAFKHLSDLKDRVGGKSVPGKPAAQQRANNKTIKTKIHTYDLNEVFHRNDTFTKFTSTYDDGHENALLAVLNSPKDMDLAERHVESIKALKDVPPNYRKFYPTLIEHFRWWDDSKSEERAIIATQMLDGFVTMSDILEVYPEGISGRDVSWIFRRMLVAVGNAHDIGLVNGAPVFDSFMVHDAMHGVMLTDWQYSVAEGTPLKAVPSRWKHIYPEYALTGSPVNGKLDLYIIASMAKMLLGKNEPRQLFAFFEGCRLHSVPKAAELLGEFDTLLDRLYGKRKFHEFVLKRKGE